MRSARALLLIVAASVVPAFAASPVWDSSGNSQLNGTYYFRQVLYQADGSGNASGFYAYYGNIAFNGTGAYTISNATFVQYTSQGESSSSAPATGTYSVSASGYGFLSSPIISGQNVYFLVSNHILVGSETESGNNDLFIAALASSSLSNSSFSGSYTMSAFFPGFSAAGAADATYQLNPNGSGSLGNVSVAGYTGANSTITQSSSGVKYAFSNGANVITWPTNTNATFYTGQEFMYLSPDTNFVFGGSPGGFDMFVGVRNASGATPFSGLYYEAGIEENESTGVDSFYGSFNAAGGNLIGHERLLYSATSAIGFTYSASYPTSITGTYPDQTGTVNYTIGSGGTRISYGTQGYLGIGVALPFSPPSPTGSVYIDPTGIVNTASSAPYTAGISPGDFLTFYNGVNLSNTAGLLVESGAPIPTSLGGVKVLIDGLPSPIFYVSPTQLSVIVPYEVNTFPIATIQVSNNNVLSNIVTVYVNQTTPGVFSSNSGIGVAAMLDFPSAGGYYVVSEAQPAHPGDSVAAYLTGLGTPFPSNPDGATGPSSGDILVQTINVDVNGTDVGALAYAGLAPSLAALYQINFTIPSTALSGDQRLGITGPDSYSGESVVPISTGANASIATPAEATPAARRRIVPRLSTPVSR